MQQIERKNLAVGLWAFGLFLAAAGVAVAIAFVYVASN